jgi:hypothetical protein
MNLNLLKITDTSGKSTGTVGKIVFQALTDDEFDSLMVLESDASYIGRDFKVEVLGEVYVSSLSKEEENG